jgi:hypothetical protein
MTQQSREAPQRGPGTLQVQEVHGGAQGRGHRGPTDLFDLGDVERSPQHLHPAENHPMGLGVQVHRLRQRTAGVDPAGRGTRDHVLGAQTGP